MMVCDIHRQKSNNYNIAAFVNFDEYIYLEMMSFNSR